MKERAFTLPNEKGKLLAFLNTFPPVSKLRVRIGDFKHHRSVEQNAVSHGWYKQIADELKEDTPEGVKRFCKLEFGVPILRGDAEFNAFYEMALRRLAYDEKLEAMKYLDVSSLMNAAQMLEYMTAMQYSYARRGVILRYPNDSPD